MLSRVSPLLRTAPPPLSVMAARLLSRALPSIEAMPSRNSSPLPPSRLTTSCLGNASLSGRIRFDCNNGSRSARRFGGRNGNVVAAAGRREYRKMRSRRVAAAKKSKEKELELSVQICLEEQLPEDTEIMVLFQYSLASVDYCFTGLVTCIPASCIALLLRARILIC